MTSKTSFKTKSTQRFIARNRLWLISLLTLISFLCYVVFYWFAVYNKGDLLDSKDSYYLRTVNQMHTMVMNWLSYHSVSTVIAAFAGFMLGVTSFNYLYKGKTVDFYFSMPKKKMAYFRDVCLNSVLIYTIISAASYLISILISKAVKIPMDGDLLHTIWDGYLANFFLFLSVYAICILAQTLCGHTFIAIMLSGYFLVIELAIRGTIGFLAGSCFVTADLHGRYFLGHNILPVLTSPLYNIFTAQGASLYVKDALIAAVAFVLAFISYKYYKGEFAGKAVVYKAVRYLVKISLACLAAVWVGYFFLELSEQVIYSTAGMVFAVLGALLGAAIISGISEIVFAFDIRAMFKRFWQIPMFAVASLILIFSFSFDWYGYDSFVPDAKKVKDCAMAISGGEASSQYIIKGDTYENSNAVGYAEEYMHLPYTKEMQGIASTGMERRKAFKNLLMDFRGNPTSETEIDYSNYDYDVIILYRMKNGKTYRRRITVPYDMNKGTLNAVLGSDEYKQVSFTLNTMDDLRNITDGYNCLEFYDSANKDISDESVDAFFEAYQKDLKHWNYTVATDELVLGEVYYTKRKLLSASEMAALAYGEYYENMMDENECVLFSQGFPVYESFTNTIAYLEENGLYSTYMVELPAVEDIAYIEFQKDDINYITDTAWDWGDGASEQFFISDPQEIEEVIKSLVPSIGKTYTYHWHNTSGYDPRYSVYIYLYGNDDICYERSFLKDKVPNVVEQYSTNAY